MIENHKLQTCGSSDDANSSEDQERNKLQMQDMQSRLDYYRGGGNGIGMESGAEVQAGINKQAEDNFRSENTTSYVFDGYEYQVNAMGDGNGNIVKGTEVSNIVGLRFKLQNGTTQYVDYDVYKSSFAETFGISGNVTGFGGFNIDFGFVRRVSDGQRAWFFSLGPSVGADASIGLFAGGISNVNPTEKFLLGQYSGYSTFDSYAGLVYD